jgi:hypothetical protein
MSLDELVGAIRAADDTGDDDAELVVATRLRVARSLETRARGRHQLVGFATTLGILLAGTVSWALATGQVAALWSPPPPPALAPEVAPEPPQQHKPPARRRPELAPAAAPAIAPAISVDPHPLPPEIAPPEAAPPDAAPPEAAPLAPRPAAPPRPPRPAPIPVEALYRRAHDLHFHGGNPAAALAAWNAYLTAEPAGRFSVDARYNRALMLIRLRRYAEARAALTPFARGEIGPEGYHQCEAEQLVERLAQYE